VDGIDPAGGLGPLVASEVVNELDSVVQDFLTRCQTEPLKTTEAPGWGTKEVLAHFLYYHQIAGWGAASINTGGPPWRSPATADQMNAAFVPLHAEESIDDLVKQLQLAHGRLMKAVREAEDPNAVVGVRGTGEPMTLAQRLEMTLNHWRGHLKELG
jgi:DinB family protein